MRSLACIFFTIAACGSTGDPIGRRGSVERYVAMLENPRREEWQRPAELVRALAIRPGSSVADVGTGSGYFLPYLTEAVGPEGRVIAQDIDEELLERLEGVIARERWSNVRTALGTTDDPGLDRGLDLVLMVDVFHHVLDPVAFLSKLREALARCGRIAIADFPPGDSVPTDIAGREHRIARERVLALAAEAGLALLREHAFIRYQFVLELGRDGEPCGLEGEAGAEP
jgi:SAM-dependent methyltransferase